MKRNTRMCLKGKYCDNSTARAIEDCSKEVETSIQVTRTDPGPVVFAANINCEEEQMFTLLY